MTPEQFTEALAHAVAQEKLDPKAMYVENIRCTLDLTAPEATALCEEAEAQGILGKKLQYLCPNDGCGRAIESSETPLPEGQELTCEVCECMERPYVFQVGTLAVLPVYTLTQRLAGA